MDIRSVGTVTNEGRKAGQKAAGSWAYEARDLHEVARRTLPLQMTINFPCFIR